MESSTQHQIEGLITQPLSLLQRKKRRFNYVFLPILISNVKWHSFGDEGCFGSLGYSKPKTHYEGSSHEKQNRRFGDRE